jgi:ketosteroid isomerase-like protein
MTLPWRKAHSQARTLVFSEVSRSPTGRPVALDYIQVLRFRDGKHASFHLMFDRLLMLEQLGLMPAPALGA